MTDVKVVQAKFNDGKQIDGVVTCDKVGEVKFIGIDRLIEEGVKQQIVQSAQGEENDNDESVKVLFGHYQETLAVAVTPDGKTLIAIDTLNRVRVSDFPNVFNIRHMILQHKK